MAKVVGNKPCRLVYTLSEHEVLGFIIEPYIVQLNNDGDYSLSYQKLYVATINDFIGFIPPIDIPLIEELEKFSLESITKKFHKGIINPKTFIETKLTDQLVQLIKEYVAKVLLQVLPQMHDKKFFFKAKDGNPAQYAITFMEQEATVVFHFIRGPQSMRYYPTIKHDGKKIEFILKGAKVISENPTYLLVNQQLYKFEAHVDGKKIRAFLEKRFVEVPRSAEETYFTKFLTPLIEQYHVHAEGFEIKTQQHQAIPVVKIETIWNGDIQLVLSFNYDQHTFPYAQGKRVSALLSKVGDGYSFLRIKRSIDWEKNKATKLTELGLKNIEGAGFIIDIYNDSNKILKATNKYSLIEWLGTNRRELEEAGFTIAQSEGDQRYLIAESEINIKIRENSDWFDVDAVVKFGEFEIPFKSLKKYILNRIPEYKLPNGQIAIIPDQWFAQLSELFSLSTNDEESIQLKKYHVGVLANFKEGNIAEISINRRLQKLVDENLDEDYELPEKLNATLRPYQKAGFDWMMFLHSFNFGGCLADDMGLGKTLQTLTLLSKVKELQQNNVIAIDEIAHQLKQSSTSLIVAPTSLIYNWQAESSKFTPHLKVLLHTGSNRIKSVESFADYDLVITSYGTVRNDIDLLSDFYFNYVILDESQYIKNYTSQIAKTIVELKSINKLILSGTPIENSISELWTQMHFTNPGLLGTYNRFRDDFVIPIEKDKDELKLKKLHTLIKPFILRRTKEQVATDLPPKIEQVLYCEMTEQQESYYEKIKSEYRNELLKAIDEKGINKSAISILTGLTKLRQIANHPFMIDDTYEGDSGKYEEVTDRIESAISENHKILIFSQFVKQLSLFKKFLDERSIAYNYIDGSIPSSERKRLVDDFQTNDDVKVFLISLKAGGVGLNLTAADYVFILDPWWNPAIEQQAVDRSHRIGQTKTVFTYKFISKNSVEEKILKLQESKLQLSESLITTEDSFIKSLSREDIQQIFA